MKTLAKFKMNTSGSMRSVVVLFSLMPIVWMGCGTPANSVVEETEEYGYDDVLEQIASEEAATEE